MWLVPEIRSAPTVTVRLWRNSNFKEHPTPAAPMRFWGGILFKTHR
jgi:hypothetical protein